ncbi:MAG: hypothetical protein QOC72_1095 [Methylobacteriaceae bacterium]|jgi:hypothetical protein|nr:hypothetical protein [Methylobacteriaceae bacterium]
MDLQTASAIAALIGGAVTSIDKIYRGYADFWKNRQPSSTSPSPDFSIQNSPNEHALVARSLHTGETYSKVTYQQLCGLLTHSDLAHVQALGQTMEAYERQWNAAYQGRAGASWLRKRQYDRRLNRLAREIADPLNKTLAFVEKMGLMLDDHYLAARHIAEAYLGEQRQSSSPPRA